MNQRTPVKKQELYQNGGLDGAILKWIAIITMAIDHFASGFLSYIGQSAFSLVNTNALYTISRLVGRLAFPIFAFLMIQGYQHTSNRKKYFSKLILFAFISEIPFDLAFYNQVFFWGHQNIFFTLAVGLMGFSFYEQFEADKKGMGQFLSFLIPLIAASLLFVDYGIYGIILIFGLGILRNRKVPQTVFGVIMGLGQLTASLAFIPIWFYNGKRGKQNKWFFYIFYPLHLFLIFVLRYLVI